MPTVELVERAQHALLLSVTVALPIVLVAAVVGGVVAVLQASMQMQDATLAHLPRLIAVAAALLLVGPWMGRQIATFAVAVLGGNLP